LQFLIKKKTLLAHAYFLRIVRTACAWQRTDALSAASLLRCACSAKKSSSGRTDCSRMRMRLLCSHTGHRHPLPGLRTLATFNPGLGKLTGFNYPTLPDQWIGPVLRIRSDPKLFAGFGSGMNLKKNLFIKMHNFSTNAKFKKNIFFKKKFTKKL
jgi:hypothetical protein